MFRRLFRPWRACGAASLRSLTLRQKLIVASLGAGSMAALCGGVGLFFVTRIADNVAVFSEVTSPLLVESMSLLDNARKMRSLVFRAGLGGEIIPNLDQDVAQIHADSNNHLQALRRLGSPAAHWRRRSNSAKSSRPRSIAW